MIKITLHYEITKAYHRGDVVTIDYLSYLAWKIGIRSTVNHLYDNTWIDMKPSVRDYHNWKKLIQSEAALISLEQRLMLHS